MNSSEYLRYRVQRLRAFWSANVPTRKPYSLIAFVLSLSILGFGMVFRPGSEIARPLSESDLGRFQQLPQRRQLRDLWRNIPAAVEKASRRLLPLRSEPHTAVVWDPERAITAFDLSNPPFRARATLASGGQFTELKPVPSSAAAPLRVWSLPSNVSADFPAPDLNAQPQIDDMVIAVSRTEGGQTPDAEGFYQSRANASCGTLRYKQIASTVPLSGGLIGGGLFTLDGRLLGIVVSCFGDTVVMSVDSVAAVLAQPASTSDRFDLLYGMTVAETGDGVSVTSVWAESIAGMSGLRAGDTLIAVANQPVRSLADLDSLSNPEVPHDMTVQRNRRALSVILAPAPLQPLLAQAEIQGITFQDGAAPSRVAVTAIAPESPWAAAGLQRADILLRVNDAPIRDLKDAIAALSRRRSAPLHLEVMRANSVAGVILPNE